MGCRGKIVDVIQHLSPKVPVIFLGKCGNFTKIWCKVISKQTTESIFILLPIILGTNGYKWGLNFMGTTGKTIDVIPQVPKSSHYLPPLLNYR